MLTTEPNDKKELSIILVDDDRDDRDFFFDILKKIDPKIKIHLFAEGKSVLDFLSNAKTLPTMLFLDLNMPKMDGEECLDRIRDKSRFDKVSIIIYSTVIDMATIHKLFGKGANRYLKKPTSAQALERALKRTIKSVRRNPTGGQAIINCSD